MTAPRLPDDEAGRLAALRAYDVLDTPAEPQYDDLVALAACICEAPIALISLIDENRQWFKARHGLQTPETARDIAFCAHTILQPETLVVEDALADARFAANPQVHGDLRIRFYAGSPLISPDGHALGALCVFDRVPRRLGSVQDAALRILSRHVMRLLEARKRAIAPRGAAGPRDPASRATGAGRMASAADADGQGRLRDAERARRALLSVLEDQQQAAERLRASESHYRLLFERNPAPMLIYERGSLQLLAVNEAFCRHYGYSVDEALDLRLTDLYPDDEQPPIVELAARLRGYADVGEWHHRRRDGSLITIVASSHDTEFEGRSGRIAVITDISDRKRAEQALAESEQRLRLALESARQGLYDLDMQTGDAVVSPEYARMLGYDPGSFHETHAAWRERLHPEDVARVRQTYDDYVAGRIREYRAEFRQRTRDGGWLWTLSHGKIQQRDADGRPLRMLGTHTDISPLKEAEAALEQRNRQLVEAEAQAHMGHWWLDQDMHRAWWADEVYRIMGLSPGRDSGPDTLRHRVHPEDWPAVRDSLRSALAGERDHDMEYRIVRPDGAVRHVRCRATKHRDDTTGRPQLRGTFQDITTLRDAQIALEAARDELEERVRQRTGELEAANRELETFTYSVSHDLKAPLRGIDGYSRLLLEDYADRLDEEGTLFLQNVRQGVDTMTQLIDDLLAYSRLERRHLCRAPVDIVDLVDMLVAERHDDIVDAGVELDIDAGPLIVDADVDGLKLALRNLLDNALKFTKSTPTPRISIVARRTERGVELAVNDNGIGFDMRFHDRIFDIFQRLQRSEDYPGTGIGLAIVRKAMQRIGGDVRASSEPGHGASFVLEIPQ